MEEEKEKAELNIYLDTVKVSAEGGMLCCSKLKTWEKFYSGYFFLGNFITNNLPNDLSITVHVLFLSSVWDGEGGLY